MYRISSGRIFCSAKNRALRGFRRYAAEAACGGPAPPIPCALPTHPSGESEYTGPQITGDSVGPLITQIALIVEARILCAARTHGVAAQDRTNEGMDRKVKKVKEVEKV
jgi:hypothetical protein